MKNFPIEKYKFYEFVRNGQKYVAAVSTYAGRFVRATAICSEDDTYDIEKGKKLAAARCDFKVRQKRVKRAFAKRHEASMKLEEARKEFEKQDKYYSDSLEDALISGDKLREIEATM